LSKTRQVFVELRTSETSETSETFETLFLPSGEQSYGHPATELPEHQACGNGKIRAAN
jgi:hypothetical protein